MQNKVDSLTVLRIILNTITEIVIRIQFSNSTFAVQY